MMTVHHCLSDHAAFSPVLQPSALASIHRLAAMLQRIANCSVATPALSLPMSSLLPWHTTHRLASPAGYNFLPKTFLESRSPWQFSNSDSKLRLIWPFPTNFIAQVRLKLRPYGILEIQLNIIECVELFNIPLGGQYVILLLLIYYYCYYWKSLFTIQW